MADLSSIGSIAEFINSVIQVPAGVSGNMIIIADMARQHVANYTGEIIGSQSIGAKYQGVIVDFAKADTIDLIQAQAGGEKLSLGELSVEETGESMSSDFWRKLANDQLNEIGHSTQFIRSLS